MRPNQHTAQEIEAAGAAAHLYLTMPASLGELQGNDSWSSWRFSEIHASLESGHLKCEDAVKMAEHGDPEADYALRLYVRHIMSSFPEGMLPAALREYLFKILAMEPTIPRKRGGDSGRCLDRNQWIIRAIQLVVKRGFKPTRNRATADSKVGHSACSIVATVLQNEFKINLGERSVETIWENRGKSLPGIPDSMRKSLFS